MLSISTRSGRRSGARGLTIVAVALVACVAFGGTAAALDDSASPAQSSSTAPDPSPDATTTAAPDGSGGTAVMLTTTADPDGKAADGDSGGATGDAAGSPTAAPPPCEPTPACTPSATTTQTAGIVDVGVATANTGGNLVSTTASSTGPSGAVASGTSAATVSTGAASATGGSSSTTIAQTAAAMVDGQGKAMIYQLALVLNVGIAYAESGGNTVVAGDGTGAGSTIMTGNAAALGLQGLTTVTQVVNLLDTTEQTRQSVSVVNVGIGAANSGGNITVSSAQPGGAATALSVQWQPLTSTVDTGDATATGLSSDATIIQVAVAQAAEDGSITISQRAIVVNFGAALALSGDNGSASPATTFIRAVVEALVSAIAGTNWASAPPVSTDTPPGESTIVSGNSVAVGNDSSTTIVQVAQGSVSGESTATASQSAAVANVGVAYANSGANNSGSLALATAVTVDPVVAAILQLMASTPEDTSWNDTVDFGLAVLQASGSTQTVDTVVPSPSGTVRAAIHQVSGVINLLFAVASSGGNSAATVGAESQVGSSTVSTASAGTIASTASPAMTGKELLIHSGDATASGNVSRVAVCQVINASASVCDPPAAVSPPATASPPAAEAVGAVNVAPAAAAPAAASGPRSALAFTGSSALRWELLLGLGLLLAGLVLVGLTRRASAAAR